MKRVICDNCGTQEPEQTIGLGPAGWYTVSLTGGTDPRTGTKYEYLNHRDLCSPGCVIASLQGEVKAETDRLLAQAPEQEPPAAPGLPDQDADTTPAPLAEHIADAERIDPAYAEYLKGNRQDPRD